MRRLLILLIVILFAAPRIMAFEITEDPQFIVINFADFYFANWKAPEATWKTDVKPKLQQKIREMKALLSVGNKTRKLAWSTLLEYMDFPKIPYSREPAYVLQVRRIMELSEEEDLPVFIPLNGVQWWNEQPELWNYWDYDGNQTPGCTNDDYASCPFAKLRDPAYRRRFIAGYNPENKWNVDWKNWTSPMSFNTRNWGGGDVLVAPSPNIGTRFKPNAFRTVQTRRYDEIITAIASVLESWEKKDKQYLFAGISIGTEVSLNGSVVAGDENFRPFGFRAIQDRFCPKSDLLCGQKTDWTPDQLHKMRKTILNEYFNDFAIRAAAKGLPKSRIYTHVWSEAAPGENKYTDAIGASVTLYSRPGMSIYGKAENPLGFPLLRSMIEQNGFPEWSAPEFSPLIKETQNWQNALSRTFDNPVQPAKLVDIYNERDILGTPAIPVIRTFLGAEHEQNTCWIAEAIPTVKNGTSNPSSLTWRYLNPDEAEKQELILWRSYPPTKETRPDKTIPLSVLVSTYSLKQINLQPGLYYWSVKRNGCMEKKFTVSTPRFFSIEERKQEIPFAITFLLRIFYGR